MISHTMPPWITTRNDPPQRQGFRVQAEVAKMILETGYILGDCPVALAAHEVYKAARLPSIGRPKRTKMSRTA